METEVNSKGRNSLMICEVSEDQLQCSLPRASPLGSILLSSSLYCYTSIALMVSVWQTQPLKTPEINFQYQEVRVTGMAQVKVKSFRNRRKEKCMLA